MIFSEGTLLPEVKNLFLVLFNFFVSVYYITPPVAIPFLNLKKKGWAPVGNFLKTPPLHSIALV